MDGRPSDFEEDDLLGELLLVPAALLERPSPVPKSIRKICIALLEDAWRIVSSPRSVVTRVNKLGRFGPVYYMVERDQRWILSEDEWGYSFNACCSLIGLDPEAVRDNWRRKHYLEPLPRLSDLPTAPPRQRRCHLRRVAA